MARFYVDDNTEQWDLYLWLKSRPWIKNDKSAAFMAGYAVGILQEIMNIWDSDMWMRRKLDTVKTVWWRARITREISELFYRNGEGFVDVLVIQTPEVAWRNNWKGDEITVEVKSL